MKDEATTLPEDLAERYFVGLTAEDLPPRYNRRWTPIMKAKVVAAIEYDLLTAEEAESRYNLSREELASWRRGIAHSGLHGLTREGRAEIYGDMYRGQLGRLTPRAQQQHEGQATRIVG